MAIQNFGQKRVKLCVLCFEIFVLSFQTYLLLIQVVYLAIQDIDHLVTLFFVLFDGLFESCVLCFEIGEDRGGNSGCGDEGRGSSSGGGGGSCRHSKFVFLENQRIKTKEISIKKKLNFFSYKTKNI